LMKRFEESRQVASDLFQREVARSVVS
jgi:hypothetical protein